MTVEPGSPNLSQLLEEVVLATAEDIRCAIPGVITSVDMDTGTCSVQPGVSGSDGDDPVLPDVPILWPRAAGFRFTWELSAGDQVLLVFGDRNLDGWIADDGDSAKTTSDPRRHDLSDALAIPLGLGAPDRETGVSLALDNATGGPAGAVEIRLQPGDMTEAPADGVSPGTAKIAIGGVVNGTAEQYGGDPSTPITGSAELLDMLVTWLDVVVDDAPAPFNDSRVGGASPIMMTKATANATAVLRDSLKMLRGSL